MVKPADDETLTKDAGRHVEIITSHTGWLSLANERLSRAAGRGVGTSPLLQLEVKLSREFETIWAPCVDRLALTNERLSWVAGRGVGTSPSALMQFGCRAESRVRNDNGPMRRLTCLGKWKAILSSSKRSWNIAEPSHVVGDQVEVQSSKRQWPNA